MTRKRAQQTASKALALATYTAKRVWQNLASADKTVPAILPIKHRKKKNEHLLNPTLRYYYYFGKGLHIEVTFTLLHTGYWQPKQVVAKFHTAEMSPKGKRPMVHPERTKLTWEGPKLSATLRELQQSESQTQAQR